MPTSPENNIHLNFKVLLPVGVYYGNNYVKLSNITRNRKREKFYNCVIDLLYKLDCVTRQTKQHNSDETTEATKCVPEGFRTSSHHYPQ